MSKSIIVSSLCMSLCAVAAGATFNVADFGARVTDCLVTTNIQAAIDACHAAGGGEVVVPEGVFRTGGLELKSGVTLRLLDGATLEGSADCSDYAYAGETRPWYRGLLRADGAHDIAVVGGRYSVIDGRNCFDPNGEESYRGPHAIRFTGCTNVTLKGYSVRDSANWAHALFRCANVKVEKVRVYGGHDGFDAHVSSNVIVSACEFHVGDDAIAGFGNECMIVRDTILDSSCSAARFGGRNCIFERCRMVSPGSFGHRWTLSAEDKRRAVNHGETLRHSGSGFTYYCDFRWGDVPRPENIVFRDCTFDHPARFFSFSFDGRSQWCCNRPLASIVFENCEILGVRTLGRFYGGEEDPLSITLKNCRVTAAPGKQAQPVLSGYNFRKIRFENVSLEGFDDPCVEKRSEGDVEIIGGTPVRVTYRKDPNDEVYTFEKAASLLAGMKADRKAFDGWMAENAARGEVWCRAYAAWRGASDAREEGEFFRRHYGYCFKGPKGVVASKRADGELSDVPFGAFVYALAQRSPIVARAALTDFIRASPHAPAAVAGAQEALRRLASSPVAEIVMFKSPKSAVTNVVNMTPSASGGWQCRIARETVDAFRLDHIEVTSPLARARKGQAGYFVLGDGRYGTFRLDNGICGERPKSGFLPVAGMKTPRGAYRVTVRGLALESDFSVVATNGVYSLVTAFRLRGLVAKPGDHPYEDLVVEFLPMPEGKDSYADIARSYREEKLANGLVKPLSERVKGNGVLAYTAESIFVRVKHGWKALNTEKGKKERFEHQSPSNEPPIEVNIDFAQFKDIMRRMKEAGIDRAEVCSVGGTAGGFDGRFPDVLPIPEEFGGERGLKDAVAYGKSLGYQMTVHFATTAMLECSRRWNPDHLCLTPDGKPLARGIVAGGRTYRLCPQVYNSAYMAQDWKTFRDLGFLGTFHIDVISCIRPYACFNPLHPLNAAESAAHFRQVGDYSRKVFGAFGSEAGMDWMAPSLDFALYTSWYPGWGRRMESPLVDRLVPFWQLVYHGIVVSNPFYATIDAYIERKGRLYADNMITYNTFGDAETRILKLQEFGGRPVFYYTKYEDVAPLKRAYDDYRLRSHLQYCFMDDHRELAPDVFLTRYSNGEETVTNYGDKAFTYRNETVPPRAFKLFSR